MDNPFENNKAPDQERVQSNFEPQAAVRPEKESSGFFQKEEKKPKKKKKSRFTLWLILILLLIIAGLSTFIYLTSIKKPKPIKSSALKEQLVSAQELTTTKYLYTNLGSYESQRDFQGIKLPFTRKKFLVRYNGTIAAGINLDDLKVEVKGQVIRLTLPSAQILSHELDEDSFEIYNEEASIFNPFSIHDFQDFQRKLKQAKEEEAVRQGLLIRAQEKTTTVLRQLLMINPDISGHYSVEFIYSDGMKALPSFSPDEKSDSSKSIPSEDSTHQEGSAQMELSIQAEGQE